MRDERDERDDDAMGVGHFSASSGGKGVKNGVSGIGDMLPG